MCPYRPLLSVQRDVHQALILQQRLEHVDQGGVVVVPPQAELLVCHPSSEGRETCNMMKKGDSSVNYNETLRIQILFVQIRLYVIS